VDVEEVQEEVHGAVEGVRISPPVLDPQFLSELPEDIRREVEEQHTRREVQEQHTRREMQEQVVEEGSRPGTPSDTSFSQLDPEVLAALPGEVREEVRARYTRRGASATATTSSSKTAFDELMRSTTLRTTARNSPVKATRGKRGRKKGAAIVRKVQAKVVEERVPEREEQVRVEEEVDMEVLAALPEDLRREVEEQMKSRNLSLPGTSRNVPATSKALPGTSKAPASTSNALPGTSRARASTSRALASTSSRKLFEDSLSRASTSAADNEEAQDTAAEDAAGAAKGPPEFCGARGVSGVRPLLRAWVASTTEPVAEDAAMLGDFLKDLVIAWRLDTVLVLIKALHRNITKLAHPAAWQDTWMSLVNQVQAVTLQLYGKPLRLLEAF